MAQEADNGRTRAVPRRVWGLWTATSASSTPRCAASRAGARASCVRQINGMPYERAALSKRLAALIEQELSALRRDDKVPLYQIGNRSRSG